MVLFRPPTKRKGGGDGGGNETHEGHEQRGLRVLKSRLSLTRVGFFAGLSLFLAGQSGVEPALWPEQAHPAGHLAGQGTGLVALGMAAADTDAR